jgi:hypothetical protein
LQESPLPKEDSNGTNAIKHEIVLTMNSFTAAAAACLVQIPYYNMWKAYHNEFNPPINPKALFSLTRNTLIQACSKETF